MKLKAATALAFTLLILLIGVLLARNLGKSRSNYPKPNAHDTLVSAGQKMISAPVLDDESPTKEELREFIDACRGIEPLLELAIDQECVIPIESFSTADELYDSLGPLRNPSRLLFAKAKLAILDNRPADAADALLDADIIGEKCGNGGLLIHQMLSVAIRRAALNELEGLSDQLSSAQRGKILQDLGSRKDDEIPPDQLLKDTDELESLWMRQSQGLMVNLWMSWNSQAQRTETLATQRESVLEIRALRDRLMQKLQDADPNVNASSSPAEHSPEK